MAIERFEDIIAWQEARKLTKDIYSVTRQDPFAHDFGLRDQIQRASVSSMTNIAEGFDCESKAEFGRFLGIARRSAGPWLNRTSIHKASSRPILPKPAPNRPSKPRSSTASTTARWA